MRSRISLRLLISFILLSSALLFYWLNFGQKSTEPPVVSLPLKTVRIGILRKYKPTRIRIAGQSMTIRVDGVSHTQKKPVLISLMGESLLVGEKPASWVDVIPGPGSDLRITIPGSDLERNYPGTLEIQPEGAFLQIVNLLPIERYVALAAYHETGETLLDHFAPYQGEYPGSKEKEKVSRVRNTILRVQQTAIRSYLFANRDRHKKEGFHLCDLAHCIHYAGNPPSRTETPAGSAVSTGQESDPHGKMVLLDQTGNFYPALFHSSCGGTRSPVLLSPGETGEGIPDGLPGSAEDLCEESPDHRWTTYLPRESFIPGPLEDQPAPGELPLVKFQGGRVQQISFRTVGGIQKSVGIGEFQGRTAGERMIRSNRFFIEAAERGYLIRGEGRGHGRGLCQWGAAKLASIGKSPTEILQFYYPEATIARVQVEKGGPGIDDKKD